MDTETLRFLDEREKKLIAEIERATHDLEGLRRAKAAILANSTDDNYTKSIHKNRRLSVPDMVRHSLAEQFPQGATVGQLHAFFITRWARMVSKPGLSVALTHMKDQQEILLENQIWKLNKLGKRR
jgi:hypothetical protein